MKNFIFITNVHQDKFKKVGFDLSLEQNKHVLEDLMISMDGTVIGVNRDKVKEYLNDSEVFQVRMGRKPIPEFKFDAEKDFWRCLAFLVDIEDA